MHLDKLVFKHRTTNLVHSCAFRSSKLCRLRSDKRPGRMDGTSKKKTKQSTLHDYGSWTNDELVKRVLDLEASLRDQINASAVAAAAATSSSSSFLTRCSTQAKQSIAGAEMKKKEKTPKQFDQAKYTTRRIALKFAYLGALYNGFEHHANNQTALPAIEEEVWKALMRCRFIFPPSLKSHGLDKSTQGLQYPTPGEMPVDWHECGYSKCGRTDRGVSAFGQVIGITVRSARKLVRARADPQDLGLEQTAEAANQETEETWKIDHEDGFDSVRDELRYVEQLNQVLPPDIRMLAWCPHPPANFDARFSCKEREYRYFFTDPAYLPIPGDAQDRKNSARLDIVAMREAASYFVGSHDFRNFCKIDPAKQLDEFTRVIRSATIEPLSRVEKPSYLSALYGTSHNNESEATTVYYIRMVGSAFLWHQVRCMVAVLFLAGQGLEKPEVVQALLDVKMCESRPAYEMASERPLVLWDCRFSSTAGRLRKNEASERQFWDRGEGEDELEWIYPGEGTASSGKWNKNRIMEVLWQNWRDAKMDEVLASSLFDVVAGRPGQQIDAVAIQERVKSAKVFRGDNSAANVGVYTPLLNRKRLEHFKVLNAQWAARKGVQGRQAGNRSTAIPKDNE